jgi:hypothetical protein
MLVETKTPAPFGTRIVACVAVPHPDGVLERITLGGMVRWARDGRMGIQFELLGARETHLLVEFCRTAEAAEDRALDLSSAAE